MVFLVGTLMGIREATGPCILLLPMVMEVTTEVVTREVWVVVAFEAVDDRTVEETTNYLILEVRNRKESMVRPKLFVAQFALSGTKIFPFLRKIQAVIVGILPAMTRRAREKVKTRSRLPTAIQREAKTPNRRQKARRRPMPQPLLLAPRTFPRCPLLALRPPSAPVTRELSRSTRSIRWQK
jgi:hypothetical protein